jgi:hypothetical protein
MMKTTVGEMAAELLKKDGEAIGMYVPSVRKKS